MQAILDCASTLHENFVGLLRVRALPRWHLARGFEARGQRGRRGLRGRAEASPRPPGWAVFSNLPRDEPFGKQADPTQVGVGDLRRGLHQGHVSTNDSRIKLVHLVSGVTDYQFPILPAGTCSPTSNWSGRRGQKWLRGKQRLKVN